jgi:hypothetical protein
MVKILGQLVNELVTAETEVLEENCPQCHFVYHKSRMPCLVLEPGPSLWETSE